VANLLSPEAQRLRHAHAGAVQQAERQLMLPGRRLQQPLRLES